MSDAPYFPPPKPKGGAYREPDRVVTPTNAEPTRKRIVVSRAVEEDAPLTREEKVGSLLDDARDERGFWERHSFWANHPRITGAILLFAGGVLSVPVIEAARAHVRYGLRGSSLGIVMASTGLWSLIAGYPVERDGKLPRWWVFGLLGSILVGVLLLFAAILR